MSGAEPTSIEHPGALPRGTRLAEFEIRGVLGDGGFGIVYRAFDHALEREVALKEYMPSALAGRSETLAVSVRSASDAETFALGLKSFVNEARLLARFDHPALIKVHRFWEANGTAYMVMPLLRGRTLKQWRTETGCAPDETWLRRLLDPLLGALAILHAEGVFHRDIAPDNIHVEPDGRPVLLDFGAARRVISDRSQALTAILKPAYAPIEQYGEAGSVRQGPWTDFYALGATLRFLLLGAPPAPATARALHDEEAGLLLAAQPGGCSRGFLEIVEWMLAPRPADRPQAVAELRAALDGGTLPPRAQVQMPAPVPAQPPAALRTDGPSAAPAPLGGAVERTVGMPRQHGAETASGSASVRMLSKHSLAAAGGLVLLAAAVLAWLAWPIPPEAPAQAGPLAASPVPGSSAAGARAPTLPPMPERAESAVQAVVLPRATLAGGSNGAPATTAVPAASTLPGTSAQSPASTHATATPATPSPPRAEAAAPHATAPRSEAPRPATADDRAAAGPQAICSSRSGLRHFACMERECLRPRHREHADCKAWRAGAPRPGE